MEAVAPHTLLSVFPWQAKGLCHGRDARVKGGVKARNLGDVGSSVCADADSIQVVRLVERRQGDIFFEILQDLLGDEGRFRVIETAVNDPMTHGRDAVCRVQVASSPGEYGLDGPFVTERFPRRPLLLPDDLPAGPDDHHHPRLGPAGSAGAAR